MPNLGTSGENIPEFSVAGLSAALQRTVEGAFARVRVRGEASGVKRAASGHLYFTLKDADAVLDACCWRPSVQRLRVLPEDGLEVLVTGRLTIYAGRSKYQIIVDQIEVAGQGALLMQIENRRRALAAEGLFDDSRKRPLPGLPNRIGVITSPTGAVIRDILHRLAERCPRPVLVWPVLVQGEGAAAQIAAAITGFNRLIASQRPDVLIVARGGGSVEDLLAFQDEAVVRAAAASGIVLISAIGHETDTTLIDFAADRRAPTPTAAAEMAVPVRRELLENLRRYAQRMIVALTSLKDQKQLAVSALERRLGDPRQQLARAATQIVERDARLRRAMMVLVAQRRQRLATLAAGLPHPRVQITLARARVTASARALQIAITHRQAAEAARRAQQEQRLMQLGSVLRGQGALVMVRAHDRLAGLARMLDGLSYRATLARGYAVVRSGGGSREPGALIATMAAARPGDKVAIEFQDGVRPAAILEG